MSVETKEPRFRHVSYLWDNKKAAELEGDEVALLIYRSNLLGADLRLTNYGGGNTSCKVMAKDPLTGADNGSDVGERIRRRPRHFEKAGLAALYTNRLRSLQNVYRGIEQEDEMVELFNHCIFDLQSKAPSIDTPLHGFLPFKHIDHLHPDAAIAIAAAKDGKRITQELFGGAIGWVPWQRPGFDLGLQLKRCLDENPGIRGIMLGSHGLFTWGDTAYESYINTLEIIEKCAAYIEENTGKKKPVFGGEKINFTARRTTPGAGCRAHPYPSRLLLFQYFHDRAFHVMIRACCNSSTQKIWTGSRRWAPAVLTTSYVPRSVHWC